MTTGTSHPAPKEAGERVEDFVLRDAIGKTYSSREARSRDLLLIVLFKTGCGTCKYAFPYLQRFHEQYALPSNGRFQIWGISQDDAGTTQTFAASYGANFPLLLDSDLTVTAQYGITHVPDLYLLDSQERIAQAVVGHFGVDSFNALARRIADTLGVPYVPIVRDEDGAPAIKPG